MDRRAQHTQPGPLTLLCLQQGGHGLAGPYPRWCMCQDCVDKGSVTSWVCQEWGRMVLAASGPRLGHDPCGKQALESTPCSRLKQGLQVTCIQRIRGTSWLRARPWTQPGPATSVSLKSPHLRNAVQTQDGPTQSVA